MIQPQPCRQRYVPQRDVARSAGKGVDHVVVRHDAALFVGRFAVVALGEQAVFSGFIVLLGVDESPTEPSRCELVAIDIEAVRP